MTDNININLFSYKPMLTDHSQDTLPHDFANKVLEL